VPQILVIMEFVQLALVQLETSVVDNHVFMILNVYQAHALMELVELVIHKSKVNTVMETLVT
jgi:hypothetical protein